MLVTTEAQFIELTKAAPQQVVVDVENMPTPTPSRDNLLGVVLAWEGTSFYVALREWSNNELRYINDNHASMYEHLHDFLINRSLVGWNIEHDRAWIDASFAINSNWIADARILWYLNDKKQIEHGYGLKSAQKYILGWQVSNDVALAEHVKVKGGNLEKGDHYLADTVELAKYAALDGESTYKLWRYFPETEPAHTANLQYAKLLAKSTRRGVTASSDKLNLAINHYYSEELKSEEAIRETLRAEINVWEAKARDKIASKYKTEKGKWKFLLDESKHPKFSPQSSKQRAELLYEVCGLPILKTTNKGAPSTDKDTIAKLDSPAAKLFVALSEAKKLKEQAESYLSCIQDGYIHFPYDTTATITERLGGFKPYVLNFPFDSQPIGSSFSVRSGFRGFHLDFTSIEPTVLAAFSKDPTLLKVYKEGKGDIYLDLCLELYPGQLPDYDTNSNPSNEIKEKYKKYRKVTKIVHLALSYLGTEYTVSSTLGISTQEASSIVEAYWRKFAKVAQFSDKMQQLARTKGYINGLTGRRLYIPRNKIKDSMNTFCQHGAHAILRELVMTMDRMCVERGIEAYPILPDCHDSTSWEVKEEHYNQFELLVKDCMLLVNKLFDLGVELKIESKSFKTFAGLKNEETD